MGSIRPAVLPVFLRTFANALDGFVCPSKSGVRDPVENGFLSYRERWKRSMVALRWILLINLCKLTVSHLELVVEGQKLFKMRQQISFSIDIYFSRFRSLVSDHY